MYRFGKVIFKEGGQKGADLQKILNSRLAAQNVIVASKDLIDQWYEEDKMEVVGRVSAYALHNKEEVDIFKTIMESDEMKDESVRWKVSRFGIDRHDREFRKWLKETEDKYQEDQAEKEYWETVESENKKEKKK